MEAKRLFLPISIVALFSVHAPTASAAVDYALLSPEGPKGTGVRVGSFTLLPTLTLSAAYDTNYLQTSTRPQGTWLYTATPGIKATTERGADVYNLAYRASLTDVVYDNDYSFIDQEVKADAKWELGLRHRLSAEYAFRSGYDRPGTGDPDLGSRPNFSDSLDKWHYNRVGGTYTYGAPGARGRLEFGARQLWRRYDNNNQEYRDYDQTDLVGRFFVRIQPKTYMLLELGDSLVDYRNEEATVIGYSDQNQPHAYVGLTWEATAKTSATAKVGYLAVDFKDSAYSDWSGIGWNVGATWKPETYSTLSLSTSRTPQQSGLASEDVVIVSALTVGWSHAWNSRLTSNLGGYAATDDYQGGIKRTDHRYGVAAGLTYGLRNWLQLAASYRYEGRQSDLSIDDYSSNVFMLSASLKY